jgi:hypothetical protein
VIQSASWRILLRVPDRQIRLALGLRGKVRRVGGRPDVVDSLAERHRVISRHATLELAERNFEIARHIDGRHELAEVLESGSGALEIRSRQLLLQARAELWLRREVITNRLRTMRRVGATFSRFGAVGVPGAMRTLQAVGMRWRPSVRMGRRTTVAMALR